MMGENQNWLENARGYYVWIPTFKDSDGDKMGDFKGITESIPYFTKLGVNFLVLSPVYDSPFRNGGYDIRDYYQLAKRYGSEMDFSDLIEKAHEADIRIIMDINIASTSDECIWFEQASEHKAGDYHPWYIWTTDAFNPVPENQTWVHGHYQRNGSYRTDYFAFQPKLNYGHAKFEPGYDFQSPTDGSGPVQVRQEMLNIIRHYLTRKIDGFRFVGASGLVENDLQDKSTMEFYRQIRQMMEQEFPGAVMAGDFDDPVAASRAGFHWNLYNPEAESTYNKLFRPDGPLTLTEKPRAFFHEQGRGDAYLFTQEFLDSFKKTKRQTSALLASGTSDIIRLSNNRDVRDLEIIYTFLFTMPGVPLIYQGDEIGMEFLEGMESVEGGFRKTGARLALPHNDESPAIGGLSPGEGKGETTVARQLDDEASLLNFIRKLIRLKDENPALNATSDFQVIFNEPERYPLVYLRSQGKNKILVALNPSKRGVTAKFKIPGVDVFSELRLVQGIRISENKGIFTLKMTGQSYGVLRF
jgi:maltose alpha-D-glucosyltransferase/alpha-amylase